MKLRSTIIFVLLTTPLLSGCWQSPFFKWGDPRKDIYPENIETLQKGPLKNKTGPIYINTSTLGDPLILAPIYNGNTEFSAYIDPKTKDPLNWHYSNWSQLGFILRSNVLSVDYNGYGKVEVLSAKRLWLFGILNFYYEKILDDKWERSSGYLLGLYRNKETLKVKTHYLLWYIPISTEERDLNVSEITAPMKFVDSPYNNGHFLGREVEMNVIDK